MIKPIFPGPSKFIANTGTAGIFTIGQGTFTPQHDILERLRKADNIPFNQLYYIAENCADRYYSKVIQTFVFIIKRQFTDRQTLLVNTAHSSKFLEEYANRQAQIWKVLQNITTLRMM